MSIDCALFSCSFIVTSLGDYICPTQTRQNFQAIDSGVYKYLSGFSGFPGFSGAGEVYLNTYTAPEKYFYIIYILILYLFGAGEAWKVFKNTFPAPEKYLYTPIDQ